MWHSVSFTLAAFDNFRLYRKTSAWVIRGHFGPVMFLRVKVAERGVGGLEGRRLAIT
jgi:hypothetical protein